MSCGDVFLAFIAIFFPPIAVWIKSGICTADSLINIALCCLGYLPGLLHSWYIIVCNPEYDHDYEPIDREHGGDNHRVVYHYTVNHTPQPQGAQQTRSFPAPSHHAFTPQQQSGQVNYGATADTTSPRSGAFGAGSASAEQQAGRQGEATAPPAYDDAIKGDHKVQRSD